MIKILVFKCVKIWKAWKDHTSDKSWSGFYVSGFCHILDFKELTYRGASYIAFHTKKNPCIYCRFWPLKGNSAQFFDLLAISLINMIMQIILQKC